jgi:hypothetical protein
MAKLMTENMPLEVSSMGVSTSLSGKSFSKSPLLKSVKIATWLSQKLRERQSRVLVKLISLEQHAALLTRMSQGLFAFWLETVKAAFPDLHRSDS